MAAGTVLLAILLLAPAASAASGGGPWSASRWAPWLPGPSVDRHAPDGFVRHGIWDAQATGTLVYTMTDVAPEMTLTATDATGTPVWSVQTGDVAVAPGELPAAFVAQFDDPDPNVLRSGRLVAYNADGSVGFQKSFTNKFVQPLCDRPRRLVWAERSASGVTRVFVRRGTVIHSLALPYRQPQATFIDPAVSSAGGGRLAIGAHVVDPDRWRTVMFWIRVNTTTGEPRIVAQKTTDWVYMALSPNGRKAAVMTSGGPAYPSPNLWVDFGAFGGRWLPGADVGEIEVAPDRIFEMGYFTYESDASAWGASTVEVLDWSLYDAYKRVWAWDTASSWIWFRHDPAIDYLAGVDWAGGLTVINVETCATAVVPGVYADAVPLDDGRIALVSPDGELSFIDNPVLGP